MQNKRTTSFSFFFRQTDWVPNVFVLFSPLKSWRFNKGEKMSRQGCVYPKWDIDWEEGSFIIWHFHHASMADATLDCQTNLLMAEVLNREIIGYYRCIILSLNILKLYHLKKTAYQNIFRCAVVYQVLLYSAGQCHITAMWLLFFSH